MSITSYVDEYQSINLEIKRTLNILRNLRKKNKVVEEKILDYLTKKDQPGVIYKNMEIKIDIKPKLRQKKNNEKDIEAIHILEENGIHNGEKVLKQILDSRKGSPKQIQKLTFKKMK
jgi:hypothetical protein